MTLFQTLSMWLLRFILAWGGFEFGMSLYAEALALVEKTSTLHNHAAIMDRLGARAEAAERAAREQRGPLEGVWVWPLAAPRSGANASAPSAALTEALRGELLTLGASELSIEAAAAPITTDLTRIAVTARWKEPAERAPLALQALAARRPQLSVVALTAQRRDGQIETQARFEIYLRDGARR